MVDLLLPLLAVAGPCLGFWLGARVTRESLLDAVDMAGRGQRDAQRQLQEAWRQLAERVAVDAGVQPGPAGAPVEPPTKLLPEVATYLSGIDDVDARQELAEYALYLQDRMPTAGATEILQLMMAHA